MPNAIAYVKNYTYVPDSVYQRASVSGCLASGRRMVQAGRKKNCTRLYTRNSHMTLHECMSRANTPLRIER